jgi:hypothetical protein
MQGSGAAGAILWGRPGCGCGPHCCGVDQGVLLPSRWGAFCGSKDRCDRGGGASGLMYGAGSGRWRIHIPRRDWDALENGSRDWWRKGVWDGCELPMQASDGIGIEKEWEDWSKGRHSTQHTDAQPIAPMACTTAQQHNSQDSRSTTSQPPTPHSESPFRPHPGRANPRLPIPHAARRQLSKPRSAGSLHSG